MRVWVDADACPGPIKEIIFRAADRLKIETTLVANHFLRAPKSAHIRVVQVEQGFDIADNFIAKNLNAGDLVITQDIPLAAEIIAAGGAALNPRGTLYSENNIKDHLARHRHPHWRTPDTRQDPYTDLRQCVGCLPNPRYPNTYVVSRITSPPQ